MMLQYSQYSSKAGLFSRDTVMAGATTMLPHVWWQMYGGQVPKLQAIAVRILSQTASASSCEHNWSHYSFVHSTSRNRLTQARASRLVWLFSNLRLARRTQALEQESNVIPWECSDAEEEQDEEDEEGEEQGEEMSSDAFGRIISL